jgi:large subunit ribosomal protein L18
MSKSLTKKSSVRSRARLRRRRSIRKNVFGTPEKPRLAVFRSTRHIYAQVIDDSRGTTMAAVSTVTPELHEKLDGKDKKGRAKVIGLEIAQRCKDKNIEQIVFDRGGNLYKGGRITALAAGAREGGLKF